ncbi:MAG: DUF47 family protein [Tetrasphaera sp.]
MPRDASFYDMFTASATLLLEGSRGLTTLLGADAAARPEAALALRELEQRLDEATHTIVRRVNASFVTPFDRGDIHALAGALDDCMDLMASAGDLIEVFALHDLPKGICNQVEILGRMAELTVRAMPGLADMRGLSEYSIEVNRLENEADQHHRRLLARILDGDGSDVLRVLKLKAIIDELERAANAFERVAHILESIALKES